MQANKEEKIHFSDLELNEFIKIINELSGMDIQDKKTTLSLKLPSFLQTMKIKNFAEFLAKIKVNRILRQETLDFVTIGETYFHRELTQLKDIAFYIKSLDKRTSVLSVPCSSGEEVYSIAMLGAQHCIKDMYVVGVDINSKVIEKAKLGKYQGRTLQNLSEHEKRKFFKEDNGIYTINKSELCPCKFTLCNVFDNAFVQLGKFDIIISRNMIIYFDYDSKLKLLERFYSLLSDGGRLYVGSADLIPENVYFKKVFSARGTYYEKI
ncbi:methyltransferase domain-containing protein [Campylobacter upsaliensis]|nr:methyltransferase domain-containing protein [Campylobacter upsaliensis]EAI8237574.1 methyltransferase domain-containing protein [Campylobacter upsaliensis]EAJ1421431.1 methyltransferase domain-containing protein [Campylobacter upsaliensis]